MQTEAEPLFEAVIVPHRSLSARGQWRLLAAVGIVVCIATTISVRLRAWPVTGFAGLELVLAAVLLRLHARRARACEVVLLSASGLRIDRTAPGRAPERVDLPLAWLRVSLEEAPGRIPRLCLRARDRCEEIGKSLGEEERRSLAAALAGALERWNHPVFDNRQLRGENQ